MYLVFNKRSYGNIQSTGFGLKVTIFVHMVFIYSVIRFWSNDPVSLRRGGGAGGGNLFVDCANLKKRAGKTTADRILGALEVLSSSTVT